MHGFGNEHQSEAVEGALPQGRNNPQRPALGLIAEQISGSAFTTARADNRRTWFYRRRPSVRHLTNLTEVAHPGLVTGPDETADLVAAQLRWNPRTDPDGAVDWWDSLETIATAGDAAQQTGGAFHTYAATAPMTGRAAVNADGEFAIFPTIGELRLVTECGILHVEPGEMAVMPRGIKFRVEVAETAHGFVCENYGDAFRLPEPGLLGVNTLAAARDFEYPTAAFEDDAPHQVTMKWQAKTYETRIDHSPFDVLAWHGSHAPYKYDLANFNPLGPALFDHPDPSIWTLLTSPSHTAAVANIDLVLFRDRWVAGEDTFRPPYFHLNTMSEIMGLISGTYDGKSDSFVPGSISLHNSFIPHGPDAETFAAASAGTTDEPRRLAPSLTFMAESRLVWRTTAAAVGSARRDRDYPAVWDGIGDA